MRLKMHLLSIFLGIIGISSLSQVHAGRGKRIRGRNNKNNNNGNNNRFGLASSSVIQEPEWCPECNISNCPVVLESTCSGTIKLDLCNCCPICTGQVIGTPQVQNPGGAPHGTLLTSGVEGHMSQNQSQVCKEIKCPKFQVCMLNIQGLPMCRCPSKFWCMKGERSPVCGQNNVTYKSKCYLRMAECESGKNISLQHKGKCFKSEEDRKLKMEHLRLKEEKKQKHDERRKQKREKQEKMRQKKIKMTKKVKKRQKREKRRLRRHKRMFASKRATLI